MLAAVCTLGLPRGAWATAAGGDQANAGDYEAEDFTHPTRIDNRWVPMVPGTQLVLDGRAFDDEDHLVPHRVVFTVTDLTKVIGGVRTLVIWDRDYYSGRLAESELAFEAQDDDGNVWNVGEYPELYRRGRFAGAPATWITGKVGARAGLLMRAHPRVGTSGYSEGRAPAIGFGDRAEVYSSGGDVCAPSGCYHNVLVIDEWNPLEAGDGHQRKFYAPGVGNVRVAPAGGVEQEELALTSVVHLGKAAMDDVRREAMAMDRRGHRANSVYRQTEPLQRLSADGPD
jgi:hypothetical protein